MFHDPPSSPIYLLVGYQGYRRCVCVWGGGFLEKLLFGKHKTLYNEQYNNNYQQKKKCTPSPFPTHNIQVSPANNPVISKVFSFKPGTGHNIAFYALPATNSAYFLPSFFIQRFQFLFQFFFNIKSSYHRHRCDSLVMFDQ